MKSDWPQVEYEPTHSHYVCDALTKSAITALSSRPLSYVLTYVH